MEIFSELLILVYFNIVANPNLQNFKIFYEYLF